MPQIILYTKNISQRLQYIVDFIFKNVLGIDIEVTNSQQVFQASTYYKINYSNNFIENADLHIIPSGLLDDEKVSEQKIEMFVWRNLPCFFKTSEYQIPFDLFSASFYLVSRYEEYLPYTPDLYKRFPVEESLAYKNDFLKIPLVDYWIIELKRLISGKKPSVQFPERKMTFIATYDIDIAYSYLGKGIARNIGGAFRDIFFGKVNLLKERLFVLIGKHKDPFDSFEYLDLLHLKYNCSPIYFFLLSKGGKLDKNISVSHSLMKALIKKTKALYQIGIHPSYQSNDSNEKLKEEIALLQSNISRQHYIRFELPATYNNLIEFGIQEDYSMGYGSLNGFRASTSHPHDWFNLEKNETTSLKLFPFCYMECNSFFIQKYSPVEAFDEMTELANCVRDVGGTFISIWHNFSLGTDRQWKGWREMYERFLKANIINK